MKRRFWVGLIFLLLGMSLYGRAEAQDWSSYLSFGGWMLACLGYIIGVWE